MNNIILFMITLFCWSPTWYLIKFQLGYVDPLVSVFYRFLIASFIIFIFLIIKKEKLQFSINQHFWFLFFGISIFHFSDNCFSTVLVSLFEIRFDFNFLQSLVVYLTNLEE